MYKYETHLHTYPVSKCAKKTVRENLEFYKSIGYDGVFITNHFIDANINIEKDRSYEEKINFYFSDYEEGLKIGEEIGLKVFCGVENNLEGTHFLIYGLDKQWFLEHAEIVGMKMSKQLALFMENGAFIVQAHPFREDTWIDHIQLFPNGVHGVEVINAGRDDFTNGMAKIYAEHYGKLMLAGSDNHAGADVKRLAGIETEAPIAEVSDFIELAMSGKTRIFDMPNPLKN